MTTWMRWRTRDWARCATWFRVDRRRSGGMVTAEFAVTITGVVFVLMLCLTAVATGIDHIRCAEASRVGARLAARAEPSGAIVAAAREAAPRGATVTVRVAGDTVTVTVRAPKRPLFAALGVGVAAVGSSVAPREPFHVP